MNCIFLKMWFYQFCDCLLTLYFSDNRFNSQPKTILLNYKRRNICEIEIIKINLPNFEAFGIKPSTLTSSTAYFRLTPSLVIETTWEKIIIM